MNERASPAPVLGNLQSVMTTVNTNSPTQSTTASPTPQLKVQHDSSSQVRNIPQSGITTVNSTIPTHSTTVSPTPQLKDQHNSLSGPTHQSVMTSDETPTAWQSTTFSLNPSNSKADDKIMKRVAIRNNTSITPFSKYDVHLRNALRGKGHMGPSPGQQNLRSGTFKTKNVKKIMLTWSWVYGELFEP